MSTNERRIQSAIKEVERLQKRHPQLVVLDSILAQLDYLLDLETGKSQDRSRLTDIILGVQAVREIEPLNEQLAGLLFAISDTTRYSGLGSQPPRSEG